MKSATGVVFAALYALAFAVAYFQYLSRAGELFADAPLMLVALPYTLTILKLCGSVDFSGDNVKSVLAAALFCFVLAYVIGALLEKLVRVGAGQRGAS
jgi:hypothetical protein